MSSPKPPSDLIIDTKADAQLEVELTIDSMAFGGKGVGRRDGKVYFVEDAIEGDTAIVSVSSETDRYNEARVTRLVKPSSHRGSSPCAVSDVCGGCQWQGIPYAQQMEWKKQFVVNSLRRIGKLGETIHVETMPSPQANGYRNRILVRARIYPDGRLTVGYFRRGSRDFVPITRCEIAENRINLFIDRLKVIDFKAQMASCGITEEVRFRFEIQDLPNRSDQEAHLLVSVYDPDDAKFPTAAIVDHFTALQEVFWAGSIRDLSAAPITTFETDLGVIFHTAAGLFQQVNVPHNHSVRRLVKETVDALNPRRILDIFCGSGNLSLPLADGKRHIDGVEFSKRAIETAEHNVKQGRIAGAHYYAGDTEKFLWRAAKQGFIYDMIIADPPREGMYQCLIPLMKLKPQHILYISCDPTTLSRDLNSLCKNGFAVRRFVALDFFPNTYHIESFVVLSRQ
jgi:23S rRNA (uracil1939-C5)-methyltransferase